MSWTVFREFLKDPTKIGAIAASSAGLARTICSDIGLVGAGCIVEYGPGTGVFTREILHRKRPGARFCAIEHNPHLAGQFRESFPDITLFEDSAERAPALLASAGMGKADCVVCGLPWAAFDEDLQDRLLDATLSIMRRGAQFATFAYLQGLFLPAGQRFGAKLKRRFRKVAKSPVVWRNLPPAFVYRCEKG